MGDLEHLLKTKGREILPFYSLGMKILQNFLAKSEREIERFLISEEEISSFLIECANLQRFSKTGEPVTSIKAALLVLGDRTTRILTLGLILKKMIKVTFNEFDYRRFWARAFSNLITGYFFSDIVKDFPQHLPISAYLLDFGILILYQSSPEKYLELMRRKQKGKPLIELEREFFGVTHPEVGAYYFENYALPRRFILNIRYHHEDPQEPIPPEYMEDLVFLRMIDEISGSFFSFDREFRWENFKKLAEGYLTEEEIETIGDVLPPIINSYFEIFGLEAFKIKTFKEWREESARELKTLFLKAEKDLKDALKEYENKLLAILLEKKDLEERLRTLSRKLEETSILDDWAQIYRRNYFLRRLKEEILRARRYGRSFGVLSIKIEGLSSIIEKYGLSEGEIFVKELLQNLKSLLRRTDLLGRTKQEDQFLVLLPETSSQGAMVVARKLLRKIEENFKKYQSKGSAFISVLSYEPKKIDFKKEPNENQLLLLLEQGLAVLQRKAQNRILLLKLEQDLER